MFLTNPFFNAPVFVEFPRLIENPFYIFGILHTLESGINQTID